MATRYYERLVASNVEGRSKYLYGVKKPKDAERRVLIFNHAAKSVKKVNLKT